MEGIGLRAMGLCYLELNAALGTGLGTDWPVAVDHGSTMETSWVSALEPGLVAIDRLPTDPRATILGVYGPNPRFTADAGRGQGEIDRAAALLAERASSRLRGDDLDPFADLRSFVERYWPEPLVLAGRSGGGVGAGDGPAILITNPAPVSRYLDRIDLRIDGVWIPQTKLTLVNATVGELGVPMSAADLGPEHGFYVRRLQTAELRLAVPLASGPHAVDLTLSLAGVTDAAFVETVDFA